jgi:hypothetical protein
MINDERIKDKKIKDKKMNGAAPLLSFIFLSFYPSLFPPNPNRVWNPVRVFALSSLMNHPPRQNPPYHHYIAYNVINYHHLFIANCAGTGAVVPLQRLVFVDGVGLGEVGEVVDGCFNAIIISGSRHGHTYFNSNVLHEFMYIYSNFIAITNPIALHNNNEENVNTTTFSSLAWLALYSTVREWARRNVQLKDAQILQKYPHECNNPHQDLNTETCLYPRLGEIETAVYQRFPVLKKRSFVFSFLFIFNDYFEVQKYKNFVIRRDNTTLTGFQTLLGHDNPYYSYYPFVLSLHCPNPINPNQPQTSKIN